MNGMELLLASTNPHKLREVREILEPLGISVQGLDSLNESFPEPVEDSDTFSGNAKIKAVEYARVTGRRCIADDSGLVVDALGGKPGVLSARFSGLGSNSEERDAANNVLLLKLMKDVPANKRSARFVCAICIADPDGTIVTQTTGTFEGVIGTAPCGKNGFGYDPLLFVPEANKTSAQMTPEEKNERSHRGEAVRKFAKVVRDMC